MTGGIPAKRHLPLDVLVVGAHAHGPAAATRELLQLLQAAPAVRSMGSIDALRHEMPHLESVQSLLRQGKVNTIFVDPFCLGFEDTETLIKAIRRSHPTVVFALYTYYGGIVPGEFNEWLRRSPRFQHYYSVIYNPRQSGAFRGDVRNVLKLCEEWHHAKYDFDVVVSFAGEDRGFARRFSDALSTAGARVFYDERFRHELLGKDLYHYLHEVYGKRARYCVALLSKAYLNKVWTQHELRSAQERALLQGRIEYILPILLEPVEVPGLMMTTAFLDGSCGALKAAEIVTDKLWPHNTIKIRSNDYHCT